MSRGLGEWKDKGRVISMWGNSKGSTEKSGSNIK